MATRSNRVLLTNQVDKEKINKDTLAYLKKYKIDMGIRELSPKTVYNYETDLYSWFAYIYIFQDNKSILEIDEDDLTEFFYFCKTEGNNSRRMKRRMSSTSAMFKFLKKKKILKAENPMEFMDRPRKDTSVVTQTFMTQEQVQLMKEKLIEHGNLQLLTYAMFSLSTMARVNAISNVTWEQIDFETRVVNDVLEKEGKVVTLYFNEYVKELLLKLKSQRENDDIKCDHVFMSKYRDYDKVSPSTMAEWCKKIGLMVNIPTLHPHDYRHSRATLLKNAGLSLESVSSLLNHEGTDVTLKFYIAADKKKIQAEKDKFDIVM